MTETAKKYRPLIEVSDWELIQTMAKWNSIPKEAESTFNEFYERYRSFLLKVCRKACQGFDSSNLLADDIFQNVFIKVRYKAYTFKLKDDSTNTNISKDIKAWLARIARNELINFLRKNPDEMELSNPYRIRTHELNENPIYAVTEEDKDAESLITKNSLDSLLQLLNERESYILMTYMQFYDPHNPNKHLPDDILKGVCLKFNIKPGNVRKIKERAIEKLRIAAK